MTAVDLPTQSPALGPAAAPPLLDTPETRDALACPLCGYSLRGLAAAERPQCPECGYRFTFPELLRARQRAHPYLFEHHPRRNVRSLLRTFAAGLLPRRFWSSLNAGHEIRPGRLLAYWVVTAAVITLTGFAGALAVHVLTAYYQQVVWMGRPVRPPWYPILRQAYDTAFGGHVLDVYVLFAAVAWPWLTLATLLVFRASMRRVRVRPAHVLRCVIYSGDAFAWVGVAIGGIALLRYYGWLDASRMWDDTLSDRQAAACFLAFLAACTYRLGVAYRQYLRFEHPWSTAVASQAVVLLFLTTALSLVYEGFWKLLY